MCWGGEMYVYIHVCVKQNLQLAIPITYYIKLL